jgi:hypothetical protein
MLALSPLVPPPRRHSVHRQGSLFPIRPATSSPWVDAGQDRSSLYPISALASLLMLRVLLCPTTGNHPRQPNRRLAHLERNQSTQIATTSSLCFTSPPRTSFRPPGRTSVRTSQCVRSSTRTHAGEHPGVPPRSSPLWPSHRHACALK